MNSLPLAAFPINLLWYALPLVVAVSLVYAATRHEEMAPILSHALRVGAWIVGFMAAVIVIMVAMLWWVSD